MWPTVSKAGKKTEKIKRENIPWSEERAKSSNFKIFKMIVPML